jgi:asparagine synthase (glutamine-hydrolysing)
MCGLVVATGGDARQRVETALPLITHRGPDEQGVFVDERQSVALAAARLSIIDLVGGHQPMVSADGRYVLAWNGEVFNAPDLRTRLEGAGVRFATDHSDTEVVLQGFAREGESFFSLMNGMYAVAIWDRESGRVTLARDPFGIKPLFLARGSGRLAAASEVPALLSVTGLTPELDAEALRAYLDLGYVPGARVGLLGVESLTPGTWLSMEASGAEVASGRITWAHPADHPQESVGSSLELVRAGLAHAVRRWSTSDVPVALSLSGGLDSSAILASTVRAGAPIQRAYTAFFADIDHAENQELKTAAATAKRFGVDHVPVPIYGELVRDNFWSIVRSLGQPYGGSIPSWFLYEAVSQEFKVCLSGTGGDELFGQYGKWIPIAERVMRYMPPDLSRQTGSAARYKFKRSTYRLGRPLLPAGRRSALARQFASTSHWVDAYPVSEFPAALRTSGVSSERRSLLLGLSGDPHPGELAHWMTELELQSQLPGEFLVVTDRLSMAHSVEARVPFLDQEFVALIQGIPDDRRLTRTDPKWLLRRAFRDELPPAVLDSPKRGFTDPVLGLLRGPLKPVAREILEEADVDIISALDVDVTALRIWLDQDTPQLAGHVWRIVMALAWWSSTTST